MILYKDFTAVIPAAGKGSRFDENKNKLLYKIKGKTIFENVLDKITSQKIIYMKLKILHLIKNINKLSLFLYYKEMQMVWVMR